MLLWENDRERKKKKTETERKKQEAKENNGRIVLYFLLCKIFQHNKVNKSERKVSV